MQFTAGLIHQNHPFVTSAGCKVLLFVVGFGSVRCHGHAYADKMCGVRMGH